jgi:hypothetical protein
VGGREGRRGERGGEREDREEENLVEKGVSPCPQCASATQEHTMEGTVLTSKQAGPSRTACCVATQQLLRPPLPAQVPPQYNVCPPPLPALPVLNIRDPYLSVAQCGWQLATEVQPGQ